MNQRDAIPMQIEPSDSSRRRMEVEGSVSSPLMQSILQAEVYQVTVTVMPHNVVR
jgi:hypothetical protein